MLISPRHAPPHRWGILPEWQSLLRRLKAQYGEEHAYLIISGRSPAANADVDAWDRLGEKKS